MSAAPQSEAHSFSSWLYLDTGDLAADIASVCECKARAVYSSQCHKCWEPLLLQCIWCTTFKQDLGQGPRWEAGT